MNKASIEALNSLKVGDCFHSTGINGLKIHNVAKKRNGNTLDIYHHHTYRNAFNVIYTSSDYVLLDWFNSGTYILYNID